MRTYITEITRFEFCFVSVYFGERVEGDFMLCLGTVWLACHSHLMFYSVSPDVEFQLLLSIATWVELSSGLGRYLSTAMRWYSFLIFIACVLGCSHYLKITDDLFSQCSKECFILYVYSSFHLSINHLATIICFYLHLYLLPIYLSSIYLSVI